MNVLSFDDGLHISEIEKPVLVHAFVLQLTVKAFNKAILHWLTRPDELQKNTSMVGLCVEGRTLKLRTIVDDDLIGKPTHLR